MDMYGRLSIEKQRLKWLLKKYLMLSSILQMLKELSEKSLFYTKWIIPTLSNCIMYSELRMTRIFIWSSNSWKLISIT
jgi:hypothetical protein